MNEEMMDLGRRAVACKGWRWMPGMLVPRRGYGRLDDDDVGDDPLYGLPLRDDANAWPDPDDPATAGCLLALLGPNAWVVPVGGRGDNGYRALAYVGGRLATGDGTTRGRACIAAAAALGRWPGGGA